MCFNGFQFDAPDYTDAAAAAAADARCGYTLNYAFRMKDGISVDYSLSGAQFTDRENSTGSF